MHMSMDKSNLQKFNETASHLDAQLNNPSSSTSILLEPALVGLIDTVKIMLPVRIIMLCDRNSTKE